MSTTTLQRILNALVFANVHNLGDFNRLLEQMDNPDKKDSPSPATKRQSAQLNSLDLNPHFVSR
jgi:hypothetical protein